MRWRSRGALIVTVVAALVFKTGALCADTNTLTADDRSISFALPVAPHGPLPVTVGSTLTTQYQANQLDGILQLGRMTLEEGIKYPPLFASIYAGTTLGQTLITSLRDSTPVGSDNRVYLTNWLSKQWAGMSFSLAHTYQLETDSAQLTYGISKTFAPFRNNLYVSIGEYIFTEVGARYSYRTTDLSVAYHWKQWKMSAFAEDRSDSYTNDRWVGAQVKKSF